MKDEFENKLLTKAKDIARNVYNIKYLKPFQTLVIQHILEQEHNEKSSSLAILPTGGGKSLCFLIPALALKGLTIIVYPLLSLMHDQAKILDKNNIPYLLLKGGMKKYDIINSIKYLNKTKIIITNVEMLSLDFIQEELKRKKISLLVIDEVHTLLSWGKSFRPAYLNLKEISKELNCEQVVAFTATLSQEDTEKLNEYLFNTKPYLVFGGLNKENINYNFVSSLFPIPDIIKILEKDNHLPAIIFTNNREKTQELSKAIAAWYKTKYYHAGLDKTERVKIESWFLASKDGVLVSTCAYGMGVDKKNIRTVIHYDLPTDPSSYIQEVGRSGRDGKESYAYAIIKQYEKSPLRDIFNCKHCLREALLNTMGAKLEEACLNCQYCKNITNEPFGYSFIIKIIKYFPFIASANNITFLTINRFKKYKLGEQEIKAALKYLEKEKKIKLFLNHYIKLIDK